MDFLCRATLNRKESCNMGINIFHVRYCQDLGGAGDYAAAAAAADDDDDDAEETALEGYETVLDKVDNPAQENQMFRGTILSKCCSSIE